MFVKPFLRWAGGKNWFIKHIDQFLPKNINNYYEPFLGGASIFIHLYEKDLLKRDIYLSDSNDSLINTYKILRDYPNELILKLNEFQNNEETYYSVRSQKYSDNISAAAQFIYLNRTSFNGIYRVNKKGEYNVPFGSKKYQVLFDIENLLNFSAITKKVDFNCQDFEKIKPFIKKGDFIFLDPPYTVAHGKNGFIKYNQKLFAWTDQIRLKNFLDYINNIGAYYLLTNAAHDSILELFSNDHQIHELVRPCVIGSIPEKRKNVTEYIFTNY